jgi:deoxyribonuclease-4
MIEMLNEVLSRWEGNAKVLLENNAGKPGAIGTTLEESVQVRKLCDYPEGIGFCLDTCHAFASGLWNGGNWQEIREKGLELGYFDQLEVIHLNNSKYASGLGNDRHANIFSEGYIPIKSFDEMMATPELMDVPFILETPKEKVSHQEEIRQLQRRWGAS